MLKITYQHDVIDPIGQFSEGYPGEFYQAVFDEQLEWEYVLCQFIETLPNYGYVIPSEILESLKKKVYKVANKHYGSFRVEVEK